MGTEKVAGAVLALTLAATGSAQEEAPCAKSWTFPVPFFQSLDWSPDGTQLVFSAVMDSWDAGYHVYVIGADGKDLAELSTGDHHDIYPVWSPDGSKIAFASSRDGKSEIYTMKADGSETRRLTRNEAKDTYPDWAPDGERLVFASDRDGNYEIYIMNADGTEQRRLTEHPGNDYNPAWSPDGDWIVFEADRSGDGADELYLLDANATRQDSLGVAGVFPTWTPDGKRLLFATDHAIQMLDLETRKVTALAEKVVFGAAAPDGSRFGLARFEFDEKCKDRHTLVVTRAGVELRLLPRPAAGAR